MGRRPATAGGGMKPFINRLLHHAAGRHLALSADHLGQTLPSELAARTLQPIFWHPSDDVAVGWVGEQALDQDTPPLEGGSLVDVALVGDLARVQRGRVLQQSSRAICRDDPASRFSRSSARDTAPRTARSPTRARASASSPAPTRRRAWARLSQASAPT